MPKVELHSASASQTWGKDEPWKQDAQVHVNKCDNVTRSMCLTANPKFRRSPLIPSKQRTNKTNKPRLPRSLFHFHASHTVGLVHSLNPSAVQTPAPLVGSSALHCSGPSASYCADSKCLTTSHRLVRDAISLLLTCLQFSERAQACAGSTAELRLSDLVCPVCRCGSGARDEEGTVTMQIARLRRVGDAGRSMSVLCRYSSI